MLLLRFLAILALCLWVGGLAALGGVAAPTLFQALEAAHPATGRELAGAAFGSILSRFELVTWLMGLVVIVSLAVRAAIGPRPRRLGIRMWVTTAMLAASAATAFLITPRIDHIRESVNGAVASLPESDSRKIEFGRLHGLANGLAAMTVIAGIGLLWFETRDPH